MDYSAMFGNSVNGWSSFDKEAHIQEIDAIEYHIFIPKNDNQELQLLDQLRQTLEKLFNDYIWQKEGFFLKSWNNNSLTSDADHSLFNATEFHSVQDFHFWGYTRFGENLMDEWFIVWGLLQITELFRGSVVQLRDNDGEFLLIETALEIPQWLNPETCENRIFIFQGKLHIIPLPQSPSELLSIPSQLTLSKALVLIRDQTIETIASLRIQEILNQRLKKNPNEARINNKHETNAHVPFKVAALLENYPQLMSSLTEAFCSRDRESMQFCSKMKEFSPENGKNCTTRRLRFTRFLYAQMVDQSFNPPILFGKSPSSSSRDSFAFQLGAKVASGLEILYQEGKTTIDRNFKKNQLASAPDPKKSKNYQTKWNLFNEALWSYGYYKIFSKEQIPSEEENMRIIFDKYKLYHLQNPNAIAPSIIISEFLEKNPNLSVNDFPNSTLPSDDDSWINISPEEIDNLLNEKKDPYLYPINENINNNQTINENNEKINNNNNKKIKNNNNKKIKNNNNEKIKNNNKRQAKENNEDPLNNFTSQMKEFLNTVSGYEGAETKRDKLSDFFFEEDENEEEEEGEIDQEVVEMMKQMDEELRGYSAFKEDFEKFPSEFNQNEEENFNHNSNLKKKGKSYQEESEITPLDVDFNMIKNLLESFNAQEGLPGPTSNMFGYMKSK